MGETIGYARCSTVMQDLAVQRRTLLDLGVPEGRIYTDQALTGRNRDRPGLREALAAVRAGDTLVVARLDRLARSVRDARAIADELERRGVRLGLGGTVHDPADPIGRMFFHVVAAVAQFETDLLSMRTREGMAVARADGRLKGGIPKLSLARQKHVEQYERGKMTISQFAELGCAGRTCTVTSATALTASRAGDLQRTHGLPLAHKAFAGLRACHHDLSTRQPRSPRSRPTYDSCSKTPAERIPATGGTDCSSTTYSCLVRGMDLHHDRRW